MTISIYNCWKCQKKLTGDEPEETFFWCDKECYESYEKDTRDNVTTDDPKPQPKIEVTDSKTKKEQRRAEIRDALAKINSKGKNNP